MHVFWLQILSVKTRLHPASFPKSDQRSLPSPLFPPEAVLLLSATTSAPRPCRAPPYLATTSRLLPACTSKTSSPRFPPPTKTTTTPPTAHRQTPQPCRNATFPSIAGPSSRPRTHSSPRSCAVVARSSRSRSESRSARRTWPSAAVSVPVPTAPVPRSAPPPTATMRTRPQSPRYVCFPCLSTAIVGVRLPPSRLALIAALPLCEFPPTSYPAACFDRPGPYFGLAGKGTCEPYDGCHDEQ